MQIVAEDAVADFVILEKNGIAILRPFSRYSSLSRESDNISSSVLIEKRLAGDEVRVIVDVPDRCERTTSVLPGNGRSPSLM